MKKLLSGLLAVVMMFTLTGCSETHSIQIGQSIGAAHGTKCFTVTTVVVEEDTIVAAYIDEFQYMGTEGTVGVPNSENFTAYVAEGKQLVSKRVNNETYSANMASKGGATMEIAAGFDAIQAYCVGKKIADLEGVDTVSGATLVDTAGYVAEVVAAAKAAQANPVIEVEGKLDGATLKVVLGAAHGTKCFTLTAAYATADTVLASWIDEFQYMGKDATVGVPNAENYADVVAESHLVSKRVNNETYSANMASKGGATMEIAAGYDAIQAFANGKAIADLEGVDTVSGATLVDTAGYIAEIVNAAK